MSVSEPTAVFAVGEFAEAVGNKRRSEDRKSVYRLALEFFPSLFHLRAGTACHACTQADDKIFVMSHAQIYIE